MSSMSLSEFESIMNPFGLNSQDQQSVLSMRALGLVTKPAGVANMSWRGDL